VSHIVHILYVFNGLMFIAWLACCHLVFLNILSIAFVYCICVSLVLLFILLHFDLEYTFDICYQIILACLLAFQLSCQLASQRNLVVHNIEFCTRTGTYTYPCSWTWLLDDTVLYLNTYSHAGRRHACTPTTPTRRQIDISLMNTVKASSRSPKK